MERYCVEAGLPTASAQAQCSVGSLGERDMRNGMLSTWPASQVLTNGELECAGAPFGTVGRLAGRSWGQIYQIRKWEASNGRRHMCVGKMMQFHINTLKSHSMHWALKFRNYSKFG